MKCQEPLTKEVAVGLFGGNQSNLARALGIGRAAVNKWPDGPIPEVHDLKLRYEILPQMFPSAGETT